MADWDKLLALATAKYTQGRYFAVAYAQTLPPEAHIVGTFVAGICVGLLIPRLRQPFRRFLTVEDIPNAYFHQERQITAVNVHCSDGDTFRARHVPFLRGPGAATKGKLAESTLQIRLAAIDTPETAKFGSKGQPFGEEAKAWLTKTLGNRRLTLTLLHKDQYARAVCMVHYGHWPFRKNVSEEILKAGFANVYRQTGAVYGGRQAVFEKLEARAKKAKRGVWSQGSKMETASEYKARQRAAK